MDEEKDSEQESVRLILVAGFFSLIAVQLVQALMGGELFSNSVFYDADVYMWLNRVEALAAGEGWFNHLEMRVNPPEGHVQHWTRPLDFLLLIGGYALSPLVGFKDGLALWANLFSPMLHVVAFWMIYRLGQLLLSKRDAALGAGIFSLQYVTIATYSWGRADHHSMLSLGQIIFIFGLLAFLTVEKKRLRVAFWTGIAGGLAIWTNVEALGFVLMALVVLGLWWLRGRNDLLPAAMSMSTGLLAATFFGVIVERGPQFFEPYPIDTMGLPYLTLFGLTTLFWVALWLVSTRTDASVKLASRFLVAGAVAAVVLGILWLAHPIFFYGPFEGVDELYREMRLTLLVEQAPALDLFEDPPLVTLGYILLWFGIVIFPLYEMIKRLREAPDEGRRWAWAILIATAVLFSLLSLSAVRWLVYMPLGAAVGMGAFGGRVLDYLREGPLGDMMVVIRPLIIALILLGFTGLGMALSTLSGADGDQGIEVVVVDSGESAAPAEELRQDPQEEICDLRKASQVLEILDEVPRDGLVLINPDRGGELVYRSELNVLTIANHRSQPGFHLFVEVMSSQDRRAAHTILRERGVDAVMVCPDMVWNNLMSGDADRPTVKEQLVFGREGEGFISLAGPSMAGGWRIYEVVDF